MWSVHNRITRRSSSQLYRSGPVIEKLAIRSGSAWVADAASAQVNRRRGSRSGDIDGYGAGIHDQRTAAVEHQTVHVIRARGKVNTCSAVDSQIAISARSNRHIVAAHAGAAGQGRGSAIA